MVAGAETYRDENGRVLQANTGNTGKQSPYNVIKEGITIPQGLQNVRASILESIPVFSTMTLTKATNETPVNESIPSSIYGADAQKNVTSASVPGNARLLGTNNEVAGLTDKLPGASLGDIQDAINIAARNASDQINNSNQQLGDAQNQFPDGRLNQLQNQFSPNQFSDQLNNRFPGSGGGGSGGGGSPNVTPTTPSSECSTSNAVLSQQEVVDIADFLGLPITTDSWTVSYFKAQQMLGQSVYVGDDTTRTTLDSTIIPDSQACVWVTFADSVGQGVYVSDVRSVYGTKFIFTMP